MSSNPRNNKGKKVDLGEKAKKTSPEEIHKNEERLYAVFDSMLEGVQVLGHDWRYIYLNRSAEVHNRRPSRELLGNIYMDMEDFERLLEELEDLDDIRAFDEAESSGEEAIPLEAAFAEIESGRK